MNFIKLLNKDLTHDGYVFKEGLNVDYHNFGSPFVRRGFTYTLLKNIVKHFYQYYYVADVEIPNDAKIYKYPGEELWKADSIILKNIRPLNIEAMECAKKFYKNEDVPFSLRTVDFYQYILYDNPRNIEIVPDNSKTYEMCLHIAQNMEVCTLALYIPKKFITEEICNYAVRKYIQNFWYVPKHLRSDELCIYAFNTNTRLFIELPDFIKTYEMCLKYIKLERSDIDYIPLKFRTEEMYTEAIKSNDKNFLRVSNDEKTYQMCEIVVQKNAYMYKYVPDIHKTYDLSLEAIYKNNNMIQYVPKDFKTYKFYIIILNKHCDIFYHIPKEHRTFELCMLALEHCPKIFTQLPKKFKTFELCKKYKKYEHNISITMKLKIEEEKINFEQK